MTCIYGRNIRQVVSDPDMTIMSLGPIQFWKSIHDAPMQMGEGKSG
jgi:hypothetical protein